MTKTKTSKTIDSYFQTENEHYNEFLFGVYEDAIQDETFPNPETPLRICQEQINRLVANVSTPSKAVKSFQQALEKEKLNEAQTIFIYEAVRHYLEDSEFEQDISQVESLLSIHYFKLNPPPVKQEIQVLKTAQLRTKLKSYFEQELERLPELMEGLKEKERLEIMLKMMPYVFPKIQTVHLTQGESKFDW